MRRITLCLILFWSSTLVTNADQMKLYEIKSGKVDYRINGSGDMMGQKIDTTGKKRLIFDHYGARSLTEENRVEKQTIMGQTQVNEIHTTVYMNHGVAYQVDFNAKRIIRMGEMGAMMGMLTGGEKNVGKAGEEMMKKMGGKKRGTDNVLGYTCDVWELMGSKQCIYKGIPLKVETNVMGIKSIEVATKAEFDISVDDLFGLPDFPVYDMYGNRVNKKELAAMDRQAEIENAKVQESVEQMQQAMTSAAKEAGIEEGVVPTPSQEKAFEDAMMQAMLPQMKQQILQQEEVMREAYRCFHDADTKEEANICSNNISLATGEPSEEIGEWTPEAKKETLEYLDIYIKKIVPCVKKAASMDVLQQCMDE